MRDLPKGGRVTADVITLLAAKAKQEASLHWDGLLDGLPIGIYTCDRGGWLVRYNKKAAELWGRAPSTSKNSYQYCGAYKAFEPNGSALPLSKAPMSEVLQSGLPVRDRRMVIERPDGSTVTILANVDPLFDKNGDIVGGVNCFQDITEMERVSRELEQRHRDLDDFFENSAVGLHLVAADGTILRANKAELQMLGYTAEEYIGRNISQFHVDQDVIADILACLSGGQRLDRYPARLRAKDGSIKHVLITSNVQFRAGKFINTRCFTIDVTDWRRAEEALRETDQRLRATYEHADIGIAEVDAEGRHLRVNRAFFTISGYSREEMLNRTFFAHTHPNDLETDRECYRKQVAGECDRYSIEKRVVKKNGSIAWVSVNSSSVCDSSGRFLYAVRVAQDITKQKEADFALRERERQFRELLEALPAAVYTTDAQGRITFYNQAATEMAGRRPALGTDEWCVTWKLYRTDGTPLPHDECPMAIALKENRPVRGVEAIAERPDGTRVPFIPYPTPIRDGAGALIGAVNMLVDISERKQAEANQRVLLDELNHRVKNNMQMLHSLLRAAQREARSAEAKAVLADAGQRIGAMAAAQKVLYDAGNTVTYDPKEFLEVVCASAAQAFGQKVEICLSEAVPQKLSNDTAMPLALILNELLTNAVKHGVNGRGEGSIRVGIKQEADTLLLYVEDDGPGFELERVRKRASGLGLVTGLARQLGGEFRVERASGTRCIVQFPEQTTFH